MLEKAGMGEIKGAKVGKAWFFKELDITDYIDEMIALQTQARKERYIRPTPEYRSYEGPVEQKAAYPDLTPYRHLLSP